MIRINLLPPEYAAAQARKEKQIIFGSLGGVIVLVFFGFWFAKASYARSLDKKIVDAESTLKEYQNILSTIDTIEKEKKTLESKRNIIRNLNQGRLNYPVFFEDLLPLIPGNVWIGAVSINEAGGNFSVTMTSKALSNFALASWLTNLEESKHFTGMKLGAITYTPSPEGPMVLNFNLTLNYKHVGPMPLSDTL